MALLGAKLGPEWILRAPAWVLFLVFGPIPLAVALGVTLAGILWDLSRGWQLAWVAIAGFVCVEAILTWFWAVGRRMNGGIQPARRWRTVWLDAASMYSITYITFFFAVFPWSEHPVVDVPGVAFDILHPLAMAAVLVMVLWDVRAIVVRRHGAFRVAHAATAFALLYFYPIGVWFIQGWVRKATRESRPSEQGAHHDAEQGDEADEAFGGTRAR
jgi:hypothetical protein